MILHDFRFCEMTLFKIKEKLSVRETNAHNVKETRLPRKRRCWRFMSKRVCNMVRKSCLKGKLMKQYAYLDAFPLYTFFLLHISDNLTAYFYCLTAGHSDRGHYILVATKGPPKI